MAGITEQRTSVRGITHRWLERGAGPPVVLVHGIPTSPELWRHVLPRVDGARLLAWELVGYGRSWAAGEGGDISVAEQAGHLRAWMDEVGVERAVLVGHDLGGGVVQIMAADEPARCAGIVLANCIAYDNWPVAPVKLIPHLAPVIRRGPRAVGRVLFRLALAPMHDDQARAGEAAAVHWAGYDHPGGGDALIRQASSLRTGDTMRVAPRLPALEVPAALVWGAADRFLPIRYGRRLAHDLGASLDEIAGGKHFVPEDHPDRVAGAIRQVLDRSGLAPGG